MLGTNRAAVGSRLCTCSCMAWLPAPAPARPTQQQLRSPGQFTSNYGSLSLCPPSIYISRAKLPSQMVQQRMPPPASFLGVGAPEALLVGVVALVVFGPKGLADAAKSVGTALRSFQPTIREVVEVSQDIKGTLEKELGLDELREAARVQPRPRSPERSIDEAVRSTSSAAGFATTVEDPNIEAKRKESAALAWGGQAPTSNAAAPTSPSSSDASSSNGSASSPTSNIPQTLTATEAPAAPAPAAAPTVALGSLSVQELEAELARRKAASQQQEQKQA